MYAKYVTNTTSLQAEVISDIAALLTGASIASLSASCDKVNTTLVSTVAPGWTLYDSSTPLSGKVVSAADFNALTTKYIRIFASTTTSIALTGSESWDINSDVGVNTTNASSNTVIYSATVSNTYIIFATPRSFWLSLVNGSGVGALEFSRDMAYLVGTTYPCFAIMSSVSLTGVVTPSYLPRLKNPTAAGDLTTTNATVLPATITAKYLTGITTPSRSPVVTFDANGNPYYEIRPLWGCVPVGSYSAILGKFYDIQELTSTAGNTLDTFSDGTNTYVIMNISPCAYAFKLA